MVDDSYFLKEGYYMQVKTLDDYRDALKYAVQREEDAVQFYQRMSEKVHQPDPKTLLKSKTFSKLS